MNNGGSEFEVYETEGEFFDELASLPTVGEWEEVSAELKQLMPDVSHHDPRTGDQIRRHFIIATWNIHEAFLIHLAAIQKGLREGWSPEQVGAFAAKSASALNYFYRELEGYAFDTYTPVGSSETVN
jgi:hypothetical protein